MFKYMKRCYNGIDITYIMLLFTPICFLYLNKKILLKCKYIINIDGKKINHSVVFIQGSEKVSICNKYWKHFQKRDEQ